MTAPLTPKMLSTLKYICQYFIEHDHAPTLQVLADHEHLNKVTIHERVEQLRRRGMIEPRGEKWACAAIPTDLGFARARTKCPHCGNILTKGESQ